MSQRRTRKHGFLCYAHRSGDSPSRAFVERLQLFLNTIELPHDHHAWCDQDLNAGDDWPTKIRAALDDAAYAVLFVNVEFLNSTFVKQVELPALLGAAQLEGLVLLPLLVGACPLPDWLARIQFLNHEQGPLELLDPGRQNLVYTAVADRVKELMSGGGQPPTAVRLMDAEAVRASTPAIVTTPVLDGPASTNEHQFAELADALSQSRADELKLIRGRYLRGDRLEALADLDRLIDAPGWSSLGPNLRGRILRTAATYHLDSAQDLATAIHLAACAARNDPDGDDGPITAYLAWQTDGRDAALRVLENPRSLQALHLKAGMLLEGGDADAALTLLDPILEGGHVFGEPNAETWRLCALARLVQRRLPDALDAIEHAKDVDPDWLAVRGAAAVVDVWRACTPAALTMAEQPLWPMPFSRAFVLADRNAVVRLEASGQTFADIAARLGTSPEGRSYWLTWRLIVLLILGNRDAEATTLTQQLLGDTGPVPVLPMTWARFYGLDLDRPALQERLRAVSIDDPNYKLLKSLDFELYLGNGEPGLLLEELAAQEHMLMANGHQDLLLQWQVLALTAAGNAADALGLARKMDDEGLRLRLELHAARELDRDEPGSHCAAIDALLEADPIPDVLGEACQAHAMAEDWTFVAKHADALLEAVPTPASLRLLVSAAWHLGDWERCRAALDDHRAIYPDGNLPGDLALLRVCCQARLGDFSDSVREARQLFEQEPTAERLLELLNMQIAVADQAGVRTSLIRLLAIDNVDGDLVLQGARFAISVDRDLAVLLWRRGVATGSPQADFVVNAAILGAELGLGNDETGPWFRQMAEQAQRGEGGTEMLPVSELIPFMRRRQEEQQRILDLYLHGHVPVHSLPDASVQSLLVLFHENPARNRKDPNPLLQPAVLIRHGARPIGHIERPLQQPRLILDLTALLTARSLELSDGRSLLDVAEAQFAPLWLPYHWHRFLLREAERLRPKQPRRSVAHRQVAELVRSRVIELVELADDPKAPAELTDLVGDIQARELLHVRGHGGRLLAYLPLHDAVLGTVELPADWRDWVLGPRRLLDLLVAESLIDDQAHRRGLVELPDEPETSATLPPMNTMLLVSPLLLEAFVLAGLLAVLATRFRLRIRGEEWRDAERDAAEETQRTALVDWAQTLMDRVATGLKQDRYRLVPAVAHKHEANAFEYFGLADLLERKGETGDLLWIDDRMVSGFPRTGTTPIIGVYEVLYLMRSSGKMSADDSYQWLALLRASNYRYIPLESEEILYWLHHSHVVSGQVVVPKELDVLARYLAACLYQGDALHRDGSQGRDRVELPFLLLSWSAINHALVQTWADQSLNPRRKQQRADWLLDRLYAGLSGMRHLFPAIPPEHALAVSATDVGNLIANGFALASGVTQDTGCRGGKSPASPPEQYLRWLETRLLEQRLRADPAISAPAAGKLRQLILAIIDRNSDPRLSLILGEWMLKFLHILPDPLRDAVQKDQALMQRLGLTTVEVIRCDTLEFPATELWNAIATTMRGIPWFVRSIDGRPLSVRLVSDPDTERPELELADQKGRQRLRRYFEYTELLSPRQEVRLAALRKHPEWWDGESGGVKAIERRLAAIDNPVPRIDLIRRLADASAENGYLKLTARWRRERGARLDALLPPSQQALLTYLRVEPEDLEPRPNLHTCWLRLEATVPAERGLFERLRRLALLPCQLPDVAHAQLRSLPPGEIETLLHKLAARLRGPLGRLHLLDLALAVADALPTAMDVAQGQLDHLLSPAGDTDAWLLIELADLSWRALDNTQPPEKAGGAAQLMAAWAHAGFVADLILGNGSDSRRLLGQLHDWRGLRGRDLYAAGGMLRQDLAWPSQVSSVELCLVAVAAVLQRHPERMAPLNLAAGQDRIRALCDGSANSMSDLALLRSPYLMTDRLGCLWGGAWDEHLRAIVAVEQADDFSFDALTEHIELFLDRLAAEPMRADTWVSGAVVFGHAPLPAEYGDRFDALVEKLPLDDLPSCVVWHPLHAIMDLVTSNATDRARIIRCLHRWAGRIDAGEVPVAESNVQEQASIRDAWIGRLVGWSLTLAARDPDDPDGEFAHIIEGLMLQSEQVAAYLDGPLRGITRAMPFARHQSLHRSLLCARARAPRVVENDRAIAGTPSTAPEKKHAQRRRRQQQRKGH